MKHSMAFSLLGLALTPLAAAFAQDAPQPPPASTSQNAPEPSSKNTQQLQTVIVTGTAIPRIDAETPSPVTVITAAQIQRSGLTTISDVVRAVSADNSGSVPNSFTNGFAAGASGVALRGLTVNSTLVLIDGHRIANYPVADDGERSFVDLNTIPLAAVERIEVLKDGASSLYGADAIAGVVNVIMRPSFNGRAGNGRRGHFAARRWLYAQGHAAGRRRRPADERLQRLPQRAVPERQFDHDPAAQFPVQYGRPEFAGRSGPGRTGGSRRRHQWSDPAQRWQRLVAAVERLHLGSGNHRCHRQLLPL